MEEARDKNGKTEQEFLRDYDVTEYFRPSVTVDAVLFCPIEHGLKILMIKRGGHPYLGSYAFPGGFVESDEACEDAVCRELEEETGIKGVALSQLVTASTPGRDPRWRNITVVYSGITDGAIRADAGDDAADAVWIDVTRTVNDTLVFKAGDNMFTAKLNVVRDAFGKVDLNKTQTVDRGKTAFDHAKIIMYLMEVLGVR